MLNLDEFQRYLMLLKTEFNSVYDPPGSTMPRVHQQLQRFEMRQVNKDKVMVDITVQSIGLSIATARMLNVRKRFFSANALISLSPESLLIGRASLHTNFIPL